MPKVPIGTPHLLFIYLLGTAASFGVWLVGSTGSSP